MWYIYTMEYYSAIKKNEIMPSAATWMHLEGIMLSDISQTEKDKYYMISLIRGIFFEKVQLIATESRMVVAKGWRAGGEIERYWLKGTNFQL